MLNRIRFVLVNTTHPGNIGAVARAMKNMCLKDLVLVSPRGFPSPEAVARASGADDLLASAKTTVSLDDAIADCHLVMGASARLRSVSWPQLDARQCAAKARCESYQGKVAIVFGRESSGLTNEELARCRYLVHIPANPDYSSLNIAMAGQILAYELYLESCRHAVLPKDMNQSASASSAQMQGLFDHLLQAMEDLGFVEPGHSKKLMRRLKRLFQRASPDSDDINILRGILSAAQGRKSMRGR
jgi:tRNA (cytidine32/uridine32-2'-O)-methyltransferase